MNIKQRSLEATLVHAITNLPGDAPDAGIVLKTHATLVLLSRISERYRQQLSEALLRQEAKIYTDNPRSPVRPDEAEVRAVVREAVRHLECASN